MALDRILLSEFRNHRETLIEGTAQFNLLIGDNGAGKTNVLEAISLFAPGRGMRRAALTELPNMSGNGGFAISSSLLAGDEAVQLTTWIKPGRPGRRSVRINGAEVPTIRLAEKLSIAWLSPAMDSLFVDGADARRKFLDRLILAQRADHATYTRRLENALRDRNRILSDSARSDLRALDAIEIQVADAGSMVAKARASMIQQLDQALARLPEAPFARPTLTYQSGGPMEVVALASALRESRHRDRAVQRTLVGPHRDEITVTMASKGLPAAECSTGEQKAMLIAITLAHSELLERAMLEQSERQPRLLLLDEVAAHLDPLRRKVLFDRLRIGAAQIWLTGTETSPFETIWREAAIWKVHGGGISRL